MDTETLKTYFEPLRAVVAAKGQAHGFGWTPCTHYNVCIGWCPQCLELKHKMESLEEVYGPAC